MSQTEKEGLILIGQRLYVLISPRLRSLLRRRIQGAELEAVWLTLALLAEVAEGDLVDWNNRWQSKSQEEREDEREGLREWLDELAGERPPPAADQGAAGGQGGSPP